jgi:hypothetical protein
MLLQYLEHRLPRWRQPGRHNIAVIPGCTGHGIGHTLPAMADINNDSATGCIHYLPAAGVIKIDAFGALYISIFTGNERPAKVTHLTHLHSNISYKATLPAEIA